MIVFSHKFGQLGNRLFAFAHLIANAATNNSTVINLSFDEYAKYFETTSKDVFCRYPPVKGITSSQQIRSILFFFNRGILKLLRKVKLVRSKAHRIIVADLPEYQFSNAKYYELSAKDFQNYLKATPVIFLF